MGDYLRITRECSLSDMLPKLGTAIHDYLEEHDFDDVRADILFCGETVSTKQKKGLFSKKSEVIQTGFVLTPQWLIWAVAQESKPTAVLAARLNTIQVEDYETSAMYKMVEDNGINVSGLPTSDGPGTAFIGLGPETAAQKFREALKAAIKAVE